VGAGTYSWGMEVYKARRGGGTLSNLVNIVVNSPTITRLKSNRMARNGI